MSILHRKILSEICNMSSVSIGIESLASLNYSDLLAGFTRKNPTKLKPGSCPSIHGPQTKQLLNNSKGKRNSCKEDTRTAHSSGFLNEKEEEEETSKTPQLEQEGEAENGNTLYQNYEMIEYISESDEYTSVQPTDEVSRIELEIIDPLNPQTNVEDHIEIIDSEGDSYARHLECEVYDMRIMRL